MIGMRRIKMFKSWLFWLVVFLVWNILILAIKKIIAKKWPSRIKTLDLNLPLLILGLHFMSKNLMGLSLLPFLIFALALFGIAMTLMYAFLEGDIIYRAFFVRYLRVADIVFFCSFMAFLVLEICQTFI